MNVHGKGMMYVIGVFLVPFSEKIVPVLMGDKWPTPQSLVGCTLLGIAAAVVTMRSFYDGSYERSRNGGTDKPAEPKP